MIQEQKTTREASLNVMKFFRLFYLRLTTQGARTTFLWLANVLNRYLIDHPIRRLCQVTPQLFVGAQFGERGWRVLKRWGISAVVNLRKEFDDIDLDIDLDRYHYIPTEDDNTPTLDELREGVEFIAAEIERLEAAAASGAQRDDVWAFLRMTKLDTLFEEQRVITRQDFTHAKPNPESFEAAFGTLGLADEDRAQVLAFEDDPKGVVSAKAAGLYVCGITSRYDAGGLARDGSAPDLVRGSYVEFAASLGITL